MHNIHKLRVTERVRELVNILFLAIHPYKRLHLKVIITSVYNFRMSYCITNIYIFRMYNTPGQSLGLLYKHHCL